MIEVGVDVPAATVMVIEHAERFGLAQLHQLRGRVGRGTAKSTCLLLYAQPLGETAKARLAIMRETEDGFRIAEEDLKLRGAGELLGTRQSGLPDMRLADLAAHGELLQAARDDARLIVDRDPELRVRARRGAAGPALPVPARRRGADAAGRLSQCPESWDASMPMAQASGDLSQDSPRPSAQQINGETAATAQLGDVARNASRAVSTAFSASAFVFASASRSFSCLSSVAR